MKICDRCKKELDNDRKNVIAGETFELCDYCANHIVNHIKNYHLKNKGGLKGMFGTLTNR